MRGGGSRNALAAQCTGSPVRAASSAIRFFLNRMGAAATPKGRQMVDVRRRPPRRKSTGRTGPHSFFQLARATEARVWARDWRRVRHLRFRCDLHAAHHPARCPYPPAPTFS